MNYGEVFAKSDEGLGRCAASGTFAKEPVPAGEL